MGNKIVVPSAAYSRQDLRDDVEGLISLVHVQPKVKVKVKIFIYPGLQLMWAKKQRLPSSKLPSLLKHIPTHMVELIKTV